MNELKSNAVISLLPEDTDDPKTIDMLTNDLYLELLTFGLSPPVIKLNHQRLSNIASRGESVLSTILITLATAGVFNALIEAIKSWSLRKESRKIKIKVQIANKSIEYEYSPSSMSKEYLLEMTNEMNELLKRE